MASQWWRTKKEWIEWLLKGANLQKFRSWSSNVKLHTPPLIKSICQQAAQYIKQLDDEDRNSHQKATAKPLTMPIWFITTTPPLRLAGAISLFIFVSIRQSGQSHLPRTSDIMGLMMRSPHFQSQKLFFQLSSSRTLFCHVLLSAQHLQCRWRQFLQEQHIFSPADRLPTRRGRHNSTRYLDSILQWLVPSARRWGDGGLWSSQYSHKAWR